MTIHPGSKFYPVYEVKSSSASTSANLHYLTFLEGYLGVSSTDDSTDDYLRPDSTEYTYRYTFTYPYSINFFDVNGVSSRNRQREECLVVVVRVVLLIVRRTLSGGGGYGNHKFSCYNAGVDSGTSRTD